MIVSCCKCSRHTQTFREVPPKGMIDFQCPCGHIPCPGCDLSGKLEITLNKFSRVGVFE